VTLYSQNASGALNELASGSLRADYPDALQGNQYFAHIGGAPADAEVRVTNLVKTDGSKTDVQGTAAADEFEFDPGASPRVTINGVDYALPVTVGQDLEVEFHGAAGDSAVLYGSSSDGDSLVASPTLAELVGAGFTVATHGCTDLLVDGWAGGADTAKIYDSTGNDVLVASESYARLDGPGYSIKVQGYTVMHTYAGNGFDVAKLFDSAGDDTFETTWYQGAMFGPNYYNRAKSFEVIHGYASPGSDGRGYDVAVMGDSSGDDTFDANPVQSVMSNPAMYMRAKQFEAVTAKATQGGNDVANLHDSAGDDLFVGLPTSGEMSGLGYRNTAKFFETVVADSTGGIDVAKLFDSPGEDEFVADPVQATLSGPGYLHQVKEFEGVHAYATGGGKDTARFSGSGGQDTYEGKWAVATNNSGQQVGWREAVMYNLGLYYNRAKHFEEVYAQGGAGNDRAFLTDSNQNDHLEADGNWVKLSCAVLDFMHDTQGFQHVEAASSNAGDTSDIGVQQQGVDWVFTNWP